MVHKPRHPLPYHTKRHYHYFTKNWNPTLGEPKPVVKPLGERTAVEMSVPKLPNELIMGIIKLADGGKTAHKSKFKPALESIKQTGGWHKWHYNIVDPYAEPPLEWVMYNEEPWCEIVDNNKAGAFWLFELLEAEIEHYEPIYE